jgi:hypothetical protein
MMKLNETLICIFNVEERRAQPAENPAILFGPSPKKVGAVRTIR